MREPEGDREQPLGGRAAERLRQHLQGRVPPDAIDELVPVPEAEPDDVEPPSGEPADRAEPTVERGGEGPQRPEEEQTPDGR